LDRGKAILDREVDAVLNDPKMMTRFAEVGSIPKSMKVAEFGKFIVEDTDKWANIIRGAHINVE
jgi:tripartite-type tricarboxylate transporter receptor subunit TctC